MPAAAAALAAVGAAAGLAVAQQGEALDGGTPPADVAPPPQIAVDYAPRTAVIFNARDPSSRDLAEYYARARGIPAANLVGLDCSSDETISLQEMGGTIVQPLRDVFSARNWWRLEDLGEGQGVQSVERKILVFAVMRGVPLRVEEFRKPPGVDPLTGRPRQAPALAPGQQNQASVDSELALLGLLNAERDGAQKNPYYGQSRPFAEFSGNAMFLTGRIDGPDFPTAKRLIDDALAVEESGLWGKAYIDLALKNGGGYAEGEQWLTNAARVLAINGFPVIIDGREERFPRNYPMQDAALYFGWYIGNRDGPFLNPSFRFKRGAVACHIHSFSAETIRSPSARWVGPLLNLGAAAVLGNVWEPYLSLTAHVDIFATRLLQGFTLAEASAMATPALSWMAVCVGDPLYRPFPPDLSITAADENDREYKALRIAMQRWGSSSEDRPELISKLETAAARLDSGVLHEAVGFLRMAAQENEAAAASFDQAAEAYPAAADRLRVGLHQVDLLRDSSRRDEAVARLKDLEEEFSDIPEVEAVRVILQQIAPPPPEPGSEPAPGGSASAAKGSETDPPPVADRSEASSPPPVRTFGVGPRRR